jgi:NADPH-dependent 2,4-dienoyl-CoA reductase/sulfur reductase-like enzyme
LRVHDGLFAAGDIAAFPLRGDGDHVRVEHWRVAQQHGRVAASNMLGIDTPFEAVPYFWTTYFTKRLDYVGHAESWDDVVIDGDLDTPDFVALYMQAGVVAAVAGVGRDQQMAAALHLLTKQRRPTIDLVRAAMEKA